ncbi:hypothetical protein [Shinella fusca]|uniref:Uncharacterized protein n=1 Tax=Shinella fusca TaxID=544480 RepID=A0A7W8DSY7_9HYPH|nr:hypothetical protein [Shinella fusca]MBB5040850.1 hypothetical protein [Shinella fusca]
MISPVSAIEAIEKAMEGVTVEEWIVNGDRFSVETDATFIPDQKVIALCATGEGAMARALYIAACSPDRMRGVLSLARQAEALQRENAELREALKPFAHAAQFYDPPENDDCHVAWGHDFTIGSIRRARALLGGENAE